jgi:hypothetical protein
VVETVARATGALLVFCFCFVHFFSFLFRLFLAPLLCAAPVVLYVTCCSVPECDFLRVAPSFRARWLGSERDLGVSAHSVRLNLLFQRPTSGRTAQDSDLSATAVCSVSPARRLEPRKMSKARTAPRTGRAHADGVHGRSSGSAHSRPPKSGPCPRVLAAVSRVGPGLLRPRRSLRVEGHCLTIATDVAVRSRVTRPTRGRHRHRPLGVPGVLE